MERKLRRGIYERKSKSRKLTTLLIGLYFLIPVLLIFFSFSTRTASAIEEGSTPSDQFEAEDIEVMNEELLLSPVIHMVGSDHPFGLNLVEVVTANNSYKILTDECQVHELLETLQIEYDQNDIIVPYPDQIVASNATITVTRVHSQDTEEVVEIPFMIEYVDDPEVNKGVEEIISLGEMGQMTRTYSVVYEDGQEVSRKLESEVITKQPVPMVIMRGTKREIPHSKLQSGTCDSWDAVIDSVTIDEDERQWLKGLMRCESGCNANRVSSNNAYHGLFQFHPRTFAAYGGTNIYDGNQQIVFALNIVRAGAQYTQFPACSR